jgi:hypothetical protein
MKNHFVVALAALTAGVACRPSESRHEDTGASRAAIVAHDSSLRNDSSSPSDARTDNPDAAANVVRQYYSAIGAHDYDAAYALWGQSGGASGKTRANFAAGFAHTADVHVTITGAERVEGAAGSQYATVPVMVDALTSNGVKQRFRGTYTLRRAMVDGATAEQRAWHIYTAVLKPAAGS